MRAVILVMSSLLCVLSVEAQITATLNRLPDGSTEIRVRNDAATNLVAFAVSTAVRGGAHAPALVFYEPPMAPLLPHQERTVQKVSYYCGDSRTLDAVIRQRDERSKYMCELEQPVTAGVLLDGSTVGDANLLSRMMARRGNMLLAVETTLATLLDAERRNVSRDQLIAQFRILADSLNRWYLLPEQQAGREIYQSMVGKLMNLPEVQAGSPSPLSSFIEQQTAMLREQRIRLFESQPTLAYAALMGK